MKKLLRITILTLLIATIAVAIAIVQPWRYISLSPLVSSGTALTVNTPQGKAEVFLDGKKVGETPFSSENIASGDYDLEIKRISSESSFYQSITKQVHLEPKTRTFVEAEIGPGKLFSSAVVMYYRKNASNESSIYITSSPREAVVFIDDSSYGKAPVAEDALAPGKHTVKVERVGYESNEFVVIVREGYTLMAEIQLMTQPLELHES